MQEIQPGKGVTPIISRHDIFESSKSMYVTVSRNTISSLVIFTFSQMNEITNLMLLEQEKQRRAMIPDLIPIAESLDSQDKFRVISKFDHITNKLKIFTMEPLASKAYRYIQCNEWRISKVVVDTRNFPPKVEVSMDEGTNSIAYKKYAKIVVDLDIYKIQVEGLRTKN